MKKDYKKISATEANRNFGVALNIANEDGGAIITKREQSYFLLTEKEMTTVSSKCFYGIDGQAKIKVSFEGDRLKIYSIDFSESDSGDYTLYDLPLSGVTIALDKGVVTISFDYLEYQQSVARDVREKARMSKGDMYMDESIEELKDHMDLSVSFEKNEFDQVVFFRTLLEEFNEPTIKIRLLIQM